MSMSRLSYSVSERRERARVCTVVVQGELDGVTAVVELNTMPEVEDHPYT